VALVVDGLYLRYRRCLDDGPRRGLWLVAVGVRADGRFEVLDWRAARSETAEVYERLFLRLFRRGLDEVARRVSDGAEPITAAGAMVYPSAAHQFCLAPWFRLLEDPTPPLDQARRRKFRRPFGGIWEADDASQLRRWAARFCRRWGFWAPRRVEKFQAELHRVLAYLRWPARWRHRLRTIRQPTDGGLLPPPAPRPRPLPRLPRLGPQRARPRVLHLGVRADPCRRSPS
jgi:transposase-like protein